MLSDASRARAERLLFAVTRSNDVAVDLRVLAAQYNALLGESSNSYLRECITLLRSDAVPNVLVRSLCEILLTFAVERGRASVDAVMNALLAGIDEERATPDRRLEILHGLSMLHTYIESSGTILESQTAADLQAFADREFARGANTDGIRIVASMLFDDSYVPSAEALAMANHILNAGETSAAVARAARRVLRHRPSSSNDAAP
jgi:hypothetical protein